VLGVPGVIRVSVAVMVVGPPRPCVPVGGDVHWTVTGGAPSAGEMGYERRSRWPNPCGSGREVPTGAPLTVPDQVYVGTVVAGSEQLSQISTAVPLSTTRIIPAVPVGIVKVTPLVDSPPPGLPANCSNDGFVARFVSRTVFPAGSSIDGFRM
jgi:hypothetical protein